MLKFFKKYSLKINILLIGMLIGFFVERSTGIVFENKINPIALSSLILTIIIALYLEFVVRPSLSNSRNEKDILIGHLKDMRTFCQEIQSNYNKLSSQDFISSEDKTTLVLQFRILSNHIELLNDIVEYSQIKDLKNCSYLFKLYLNYKKAFTGFGFDKKEFTYNKVYFSKRDFAYKAFDKALMHLIFDVNKL